MTIDAYLAELRRLLPATRRGRFLREAEDHLRDAAQAFVTDGLDPEAAAARAVGDFGSAGEIALRLRRETAPVAVRWAAGVALLGLGLLFLPLYAVPENLLPPAPWDERPGYLGVLLGVALSGWLAALALATLAMLVRPRLAAPALVASAMAGCVSGLAGLVTAVAWHLEVPATPWSVVAIGTPLSVAAVGTAVGSAVWARTRVSA